MKKLKAFFRKSQISAPIDMYVIYALGAILGLILIGMIVYRAIKNG